MSHEGEQMALLTHALDGRKIVPYHFRSAALDQTLMIICEEDLPNPSRRLSTSDPDAKESWLERIVRPFCDGIGFLLRQWVEN